MNSVQVKPAKGAGAAGGGAGACGSPPRACGTSTAGSLPAGPARGGLSSPPAVRRASRLCWALTRRPRRPGGDGGRELVAGARGGKGGRGGGGRREASWGGRGRTGNSPIGPGGGERQGRRDAVFTPMPGVGPPPAAQAGPL